MKQPPDKSAATYQVTSVVRACRILSAFAEAGEVLELPAVVSRTGLHRATAFRLLATLVQAGFLERVGTHGYRSCCELRRSRRFRVGYAEQNAINPYISTVTASLRFAAASAGLDLLVVNNQGNRRIALRNADYLVAQKVDLAIEFQLVADISEQISERFRTAGIPLIALDNPHPGAVYFGADNFKAGAMAGQHLGRWTAQHWSGAADELLLLTASVGGPILEARLQGVMTGLAAVLPGTRGIARVRLETHTHFDVALEVVRRHLRRTNAQRILVAAVNDPTALGALEAFREYGRESHCAVVSHDGAALVRRELRRSGTRLVAVVAYFPETYGERLAPLILEMLHRRPVPPAVYTKHVLLTPNNVNSVYANDLLVADGDVGVEWPVSGKALPPASAIAGWSG